ncbi:MAG TPA: M28 family metallopeptidase [Blastocatellia bacterium]|nr:M28 family metallopeptidase [Blastocatellia bacterium]
MRPLRSLLLLLILCCAGAPSSGLLPGPKGTTAQQAQLSSRLNPKIERIVEEISPVFIEATIRKLVGFGTRHTLSQREDPERGIGAAARWIRGEFERYSRESGGRLQVTVDEFVQPPAPRVKAATTLTNIVATLPGTQSGSEGRIYVVSGHYDSICFPYDDPVCDAPGANDDASGTAAVLEMARIMSKRQFDATIVFMAVAGEEQGLLGSTHWAEEARKRNLRIEAMFTNDIIGNTWGGNGVRDNRRVRLFSEGVPSSESEAEARTRQSVGGENDSPSRQLARYIKETGERYLRNFEVTLVFRRDRYGRGGDHIPFLQRGYPAVRFTEPNEDFTRQHQKVREEHGVKYGDVVEMVDFGYIAQVARINAAALAGLALAPASPAGVKFGSARQEYEAELSWQPNSEPDLAGYRVVWRETYQPFWQYSVEVGKANQLVMKGLSKDDFFFAVQAIDNEGNVSVPAFPRSR